MLCYMMAPSPWIGRLTVKSCPRHPQTHAHARGSPQLQALAKRVGVKANGKTADLVVAIRCVRACRGTCVCVCVCRGLFHHMYRVAHSRVRS